jgi:orotate phosphoribosyltransferase
MQYPRYGLRLAQMLVDKLWQQGLRPTTVIGPALGAVHWEVFVATALDEKWEDEGGKPVRAMFAERPSGSDTFEIRRGLHLEPGEEVLVVEDVITTGGSAMQVVELVEFLGAKPCALATIVDRSNGKAKFEIPFISLLELNIESYSGHACPLCQRGESLVKPGSRKAIG